MALLNRAGIPGGSRPPLRSVAAGLLLAALFAAGRPAASHAPLPPSREYQVKAVYLFNFAQFVEWPAAAFSAPDAPLVIGVLGEDPFGAYLDETVRDERVNGRPLVVRRFARAEEVASCHVLFVSRSEAGRLEPLFTALRGRPILTVGDGEAFARRGGMIRLVTDQGRVRMRINLEAAKAAGLQISSKLLRPAQIVSPGGE